jgi:serine O-acetyltransferase
MIFKRLREEIESIRARDPAARSGLEVLLCYPGLHAVLFHLVANRAWRARLYMIARAVSQLGRFLTGIEIHPAATIGRRLFIDHGSGVVIGETAEIGDDVTLYHGVTLGGTSLNTGKRHPTLADGVIVGAGAKILGPVLVGKDARVGANAVVLADVPPGVTMVGIPARVVVPKHKTEGFHPYGCDEDLPDPVLRAVETLRKEMARMQARIDELEAEKWPVAAPALHGETEPAKGDAP